MVVVYSTFPNEKNAIEIGRKLLEERLIACFNLFHIKSGYWWEGKITEDTEVAALFKTKRENLERVMEEIKRLHPYQVPAIFSFSPESVDESYLKWLTENVL